MDFSQAVRRLRVPPIAIWAIFTVALPGAGAVMGLLFRASVAGATGVVMVVGYAMSAVALAVGLVVWRAKGTPEVLAAAIRPTTEPPQNVPDPEVWKRKTRQDLGIDPDSLPERAALGAATLGFIVNLIVWAIAGSVGVWAGMLTVISGTWLPLAILLPAWLAVHVLTRPSSARLTAIMHAACERHS